MTITGSSDMAQRGLANNGRGALVVMEGCDRAGKTTQCRLLMEHLTAQGHKVQCMKFPERSTTIGKAINAYLTNASELPDEAIHLLFSANRWELVPAIEEALKQGISLIVDRYVYSGVAFSVAKGLSRQWCQEPDIGLPRPDIVVFLDLPPEQAAERAAYGTERYETPPLQRKVYTEFEALRNAANHSDGNSIPWHVINANQSIDAVQQELRAVVEPCLQTPRSRSDTIPTLGPIYADISTS